MATLPQFGGMNHNSARGGGGRPTGKLFGAAAEPAGACTVMAATVLPKEGSMAQCEVCGNDYDKALKVSLGGKTMTFDSFECAIHALAPHCAHCDCRVIGHGVEAGGKIFCCANCAKQEGVKGLSDRAA